jgi:hypothetical protein
LRTFEIRLRNLRRRPLQLEAMLVLPERRRARPAKRILTVEFPAGASFAGKVVSREEARGRAIWRHCIPASVSGGAAPFAEWPAREGARNLDRINARLRHIRETAV